MADNTVTAAPAELKRSLTYEDRVLKKIAGIATDEVPGIITLTGGLIGGLTDRFRDQGDKTKGVDVEVGERQVALDLNVVVEYGHSVPDIFTAVIKKITTAVKAMTNLDVVEVNMHVEDILAKEEFEKQRRKMLEAAAAAQKEKPVTEQRVE